MQGRNKRRACPSELQTCFSGAIWKARMLSRSCPDAPCTPAGRCRRHTTPLQIEYVLCESKIAQAFGLRQMPFFLILLSDKGSLYYDCWHAGDFCRRRQVTTISKFLSDEAAGHQNDRIGIQWKL